MNVWYSYDPEDGYSTHASAEEAREGAAASLEYHRDRSTDGWHENTSDIEWGLLVPFGEARECQRRETPGGDFDYICDYQIVSAPCDDPLEQAYLRLERSTDWHEQRYAAVRAWVESEVRPLSEDVARRYYSVVANGTPCPYQPADWSSTVHGLTLRAENAERQRDTAREEVERLLLERNAAFDDNARLRLALRSCADIGEARVAKVIRDALTQDFEKPGEAVVTAGDLIGLRRR